MKVRTVSVERVFQPYDLTITIESEKEEKALMALMNMNIRGPDTVEEWLLEVDADSPFRDRITAPFGGDLTLLRETLSDMMGRIAGELQ